MSVKKNRPQSAKDGKFVSEEFMEANKETTVETTITVPIKKYREAEEILKKLDNKFQATGIGIRESGMHDILNWLCNNSEKPEID